MVWKIGSLCLRMLQNNSLRNFTLVRQLYVLNHKDTGNLFNYKWEVKNFRPESTLTSITEARPPERKYKNPVDWLPFPWYRRARNNIFEKSGDLVKRNIIDPSLPKPDFEFSEELNTANDNVKSVFTVATASKSEAVEAYRRHVLKRIQRHPFDFDSIEVKIALKTIQIRSMFQHVAENKKETRGKHVLGIIITKRNKLLKMLRKTDMDRFNWLLKELQLEFTPEPMGIKNEKYCKKWDLRRLTREYCEKMIKTKRDAYHEELKSQQKEFLKEKAEILAWIEKEERALGVQNDEGEIKN